MSLHDLVGKLKSIARTRSEEKPNLIPFEFSPEIADQDEVDLKCTEGIYPSRVDLPEDARLQNDRLKRWADGCKVLLSGIHLEIGMSYLDAKSNLTNREIEVSKIFRGEGDRRYFSGLCRLRQAHRSFREDRMLQLIDLETGEIFDPASEFFDRYSLFDSPKMEELQIIIHILLYLAKADRTFLDVEKDVISDIVSQYCRGQKRELIETYAFNHKVKKQDFLNEVSKLPYMDEYAVWNLMNYAEEIINIDGKVTKKEQEFFDLLHAEARIRKS